jgi:hypothetical protein
LRGWTHGSHEVTKKDFMGDGTSINIQHAKRNMSWRVQAARRWALTWDTVTSLVSTSEHILLVVVRAPECQHQQPVDSIWMKTSWQQWYSGPQQQPRSSLHWKPKVTGLSPGPDGTSVFISIQFQVIQHVWGMGCTGYMNLAVAWENS